MLDYKICIQGGKTLGNFYHYIRNTRIFSYKKNSPYLITRLNKENFLNKKILVFSMIFNLICRHPEIVPLYSKSGSNGVYTLDAELWRLPLFK